MNSAKTLLVVAVLAAIGVGSYMAFNRPQPPDPPIDDWTQSTETNLGAINGRNSANTGDLNPNATPGGEARRWDPQGSPVASGSERLAPFPGNRGFEQQGSGGHGLYGSRTDPGHSHTTAGELHDTIPNSDTPSGKFGSRGDASVPSPRSDYGQPAFGAAADVDRSRIDPLRLTSSTYSDAMVYAQELIRQNQLAEALEMLSRFYDKPELSSAEHRQLNTLLDQLAGTVVYSRDYFIEGRPYIVRGGERLEDIARDHKVSWQLLAKINGIDDPARLEQGQKLKVVEGPFEAIISLGRGQLTLMVQNRYAGRFPIDVRGTAPPGPTHVRTKNSSGDRFLELDNRVRICGPQHVGIATGGTNGCTAVLSQQDIEDLFDILQESCDVLIRR